MLILDGKTVAAKVRSKVKADVTDFKARYGRPPGLAVVLVGEDPASQVYVKNKIKACEEAGIASFHLVLPVETNEQSLISKVQELNSDEKVDGILVQLPLPQHLQADKIIENIRPEKDVDGLTEASMGALFSGRKQVAPCTPAGVIEILKHYQIPIAGRSAVVIGRSQIVGRPMFALLLEEDATVTLAHSKTKDLEAITRQADIVVVAAGKPRFLGKEAFKKEAIVIDVGIHRRPEGLCGDVRFEELEGHVSAATPVPGGVGAMTIAQLLVNTLSLAQRRKKN